MSLAIGNGDVLQKQVMVQPRGPTRIDSGAIIFRYYIFYSNVADFPPAAFTKSYPRIRSPLHGQVIQSDITPVRNFYHIKIWTDAVENDCIPRRTLNGCI